MPYWIGPCGSFFHSTFYSSLEFYFQFDGDVVVTTTRLIGYRIEGLLFIWLLVKARSTISPPFSKTFMLVRLIILRKSWLLSSLWSRVSLCRISAYEIFFLIPQQTNVKFPRLLCVKLYELNPLSDVKLINLRS